MDQLFVMYAICKIDEKFRMETVLNLLTQAVHQCTVGWAIIRCMCVTIKIEIHDY
jgi:hypothetical protein